MPHIPALWYLNTSVTYPQWFRRVKFVVTPHVLYSSYICEILLFKRHLVVITHRLIYSVRAAYRQGKIAVKKVSYQLILSYYTFIVHLLTPSVAYFQLSILSKNEPSISLVLRISDLRNSVTQALWMETKKWNTSHLLASVLNHCQQQRR